LPDDVGLTIAAALVAVAGSRTGLLVSNDRLGRWLKKVQGKIVNGLCLLQAGNVRGYPLWRLSKT
jgi:hypothetical protein